MFSKSITKPIADRFAWTKRVFAALTNNIKNRVVGSQRSIATKFSGSLFSDASGNNYDLEIEEVPIRDRHRARQILEILEHCPEATTILEIYKTDVRSSHDGDDQGFTISDFMGDGKTPVNPDVKSVALELFERLFPVSTIDLIIDTALGKGNFFGSMGFTREGFAKDSNAACIGSLLCIPPYECFRIESDDGRLLGFEQRRSLTEQNVDYFWHPAQMVHIRYRRKNLYGQSIWQQSLWDWQEYKKSRDEYAIGRRALALNPRKHIFPQNYKPEQMKQYREDLNNKIRNGGQVLTDFFMPFGGDVVSLGQGNSGIKDLMDAFMMHRTQMIMPSQVPSWRLAGFKGETAQDYVGQPALAWVRTLNGVRAILVEGISQVLDTELILRFGADWYFANAKGKYRIVFPEIRTSLSAPLIEDPNNIGVKQGIADVSGDRLLTTEELAIAERHFNQAVRNAQANGVDRNVLASWVESLRDRI